MVALPVPLDQVFTYAVNGAALWKWDPVVGARCAGAVQWARSSWEWWC